MHLTSQNFVVFAQLKPWVRKTPIKTISGDHVTLISMLYDYSSLIKCSPTPNFSSNGLFWGKSAIHFVKLWKLHQNVLLIKSNVKKVLTHSVWTKKFVSEKSAEGGFSASFLPLLPIFLFVWNHEPLHFWGLSM